MEELARQQLDMTEQTGAANFESLSFKTSATNGFPSCEIIYRFQTDGQLVRQMQTLIFARETIFAITGTALDSNFSEWHPKFQQITDSFRVFDPDTIKI